ncbi:MAG TPA: NUDIX hydrolase [Jiangellaceae bacterium]
MGTEIADRPEAWPVEESHVRFDGAVVSVRSDVVRSPVDDSTFTRDVVVHPGAVAVVALDDADRVLLVSQYRHPAGFRLLEIPAGLRDIEGELPHECAARELHEEGHVRAGDWRVLADIFSSPGMTDEALRVFLARDLTPVADDERHAGVHEEADLPVVWAPLADVVAAVLAGHVQNATTAVGVLAAWTARHGTGYDDLRPVSAAWPAGEPGRPTRH